MKSSYTPPSMLPLPRTLDELYSALAPYHRDQRPLDLFFEFYIVDVIGFLPPETDDAIGQLIAKHPAFFASSGGDWRRGVPADLHLSDTIDIAILDLWHTNVKNAAIDAWNYKPWHFAKDFLANYLADDSRVDVWEGNALESARARVRAARRTI